MKNLTTKIALLTYFFIVSFFIISAVSHSIEINKTSYIFSATQSK